jgi:hypothetical protein
VRLIEVVVSNCWVTAPDLTTEALTERPRDCAPERNSRCGQILARNLPFSGDALLSTHGQVQPVIVFPSNVTAAVLASSLPVTVAPVVTVIAVEASIFPWNAVVVPRVAELPTTKKTLQA